MSKWKERKTIKAGVLDPPKGPRPPGSPKPMRIHFDGFDDYRLYKTYKKLYEEETGHKSYYNRESVHFIGAVKMGKRMLALIIQEMKNEPEWFDILVLGAIFKECNPMQSKSAGYIDRICQDWIDWYEKDVTVMSKLTYRRGNMFEHLTGKELIVHACNGQGVWGSGFARQLADKYPEAYEEFRDYLELQLKKYSASGFYKITSHEVDNINYQTQHIGNCVTSLGYGDMRDLPPEILMNTRISVYSMLKDYCSDEITVFSPRINSGLFKVDWDKTEKMIIEAIDMSRKKVNWVVWDL